MELEISPDSSPVEAPEPRRTPHPEVSPPEFPARPEPPVRPPDTGVFLYRREW
jgi:hypothetical protein